MGMLFSKVWARMLGSQEMKILMVGLDAAGKTTILYRLKLAEVVTTIPTVPWPGLGRFSVATHSCSSALNGTGNTVASRVSQCRCDSRLASTWKPWSTRTSNSLWLGFPDPLPFHPCLLSSEAAVLRRIKAFTLLPKPEDAAISWP